MVGLIELIAMFVLLYRGAIDQEYTLILAASIFGVAYQISSFADAYRERHPLTKQETKTESHNQ